MTAEEQKKMQELEAENAALKERLLVAQRTLAKYGFMGKSMCLGIYFL